MNSVIDESESKVIYSFSVQVFLVDTRNEAVPASLPMGIFPKQDDGFSIQVATLRSPFLEKTMNTVSWGQTGKQSSSLSLTERFQETMRDLTAFTAQDQRHIARLIELSDLVVIAYDASTTAQRIVQSLEKLSAVLGVDTLLFPLEPAPAICFEPFRASFRSALHPGESSAPAHWAQILAAILHSSYSEGLICVDWNDVVRFFDNIPQSTWCVSQGPTIESAAALAVERLQIGCAKGEPKGLMLIFLGDDSIGMRTIKRTLSAVQEVILNIDPFIFAAPLVPWVSPCVITITNFHDKMLST